MLADLTGRRSNKRWILRAALCSRVCFLVTNVSRWSRSIRMTTVFLKPGRNGAARLRPRRVQILRGPLPSPVAALRAALYTGLAPIANRWNEALGIACATRRASPSSSPAAIPAASRADAAAAPIRSRRLQLPAPGSLRRARFSVAGGGPAVRSRGAISPAESS